ncbi:MAG: caspase family protein [Treponema sp.]|jgi:hypothetical protein|nr:caspase family protein [Treponema sp.]
MKVKWSIVAVLYFFVTAALVFGVQDESSTRRFGIFIGSNNGGRDRIALRYAVSDARSISNVFFEMGGIASEDSVLLVEPSVRDINNRIDAVHEQVLRSRETNKRTEIVFYYSGHSDEEGLLLNNERYLYTELRSRINSIPSDMRIVILDSCASGAFTRLKGGEKTLPFLMDSSLTAEGYAFLTSSSADEASQESDRIEASYFTHSLVAGLRGAADSIGDRRVTLNELYRFAYNETLARTETSLYGSQHPSYDIQMSGTGDLVLTDISETSAGVVFDESLTGRLSIRNSRDILIAEINKIALRPLELGLEPGLYRVTLQQGSAFLRAEFTLVEGRRTIITRNNFINVTAEPARRRGTEDTAPVQGTSLYTFFFNIVYEPFRFPLLGFVNVANGNHTSAQVSFINWNTGNFTGVQASFINMTGGNFNGVQASFINTVVGQARGLQLGFINTAVKEMAGPQIGFVNVAANGIKGPQFGFINYADNVEHVAPIGFLSIVRKGGYRAVEYSFSEFHTYNAGLKIGVDKFYTTFIFSYNYSENSSWSNFAAGLGVGSILPIGDKFFFNPELNGVSSVGNLDTKYNLQSFVPYFGFNLGRFNFSAGPSVTLIYSETAAMPKPLFSIYTYDINEKNRIVIGARAALRVRL